MSGAVRTRRNRSHLVSVDPRTAPSGGLSPSEFLSRPPGPDAAATEHPLHPGVVIA